MDELKDITDNFGTKALIGEGSYGRVYHGVLRSGPAAAIKKLDSSKQPKQEFLAQVGPFMFDIHTRHGIQICAQVSLTMHNLNRSPWYQD